MDFWGFSLVVVMIVLLLNFFGVLVFCLKRVRKARVSQFSEFFFLFLFILKNNMVGIEIRVNFNLTGSLPVNG